MERARQVYQNKPRATKSTKRQWERNIQEEDVANAKNRYPIEHPQAQAWQSGPPESNVPMKPQATSPEQTERSQLKPQTYSVNTTEKDQTVQRRIVTDSTGVKASLSATNMTVTQIERSAKDEEPNTQRRVKKEKLFYFPIKRDTLISMLPKHLHDRYVSLKDITTTGEQDMHKVSQETGNETLLTVGSSRENFNTAVTDKQRGNTSNAGQEHPDVMQEYYEEPQSAKQTF